MINDISAQAWQGMVKFFDSVKVKDVMLREFGWMYEDEDFSIAQQKFVDSKMHYLIVTDREDRVVGLLSRKYVYKAHSPKKILQEELEIDPGIIIDGDSFYEKDTLNSYILRNVMSRKPFCLLPEDSLKKAMVTMSQKKVSCIPVVDTFKHPIGILTHQEIVDLIAHFLER